MILIDLFEAEAICHSSSLVGWANSEFEKIIVFLERKSQVVKLDIYIMYIYVCVLIRVSELSLWVLKLRVNLIYPFRGIKVIKKHNNKKILCSYSILLLWSYSYDRFEKLSFEKNKFKEFTCCYRLLGAMIDCGFNFVSLFYQLNNVFSTLKYLFSPNIFIVFVFHSRLSFLIKIFAFIFVDTSF